MSEALLGQLAVGLFTVGGAWAVMRVQLQRAVKDIDELRDTAASRADLEKVGKDLAITHALLTKVSLQVAYLNGQLAGKGIITGSMPDALKLP